MSKLLEVIQESVPSQEAANKLMGRLFETAHPSSVFSEPVTQGEYTVITAAEVSVGLGMGYGSGGGEGIVSTAPAGEGDEIASEAVMPGLGGGGGGGGGGSATARPIAAIEIGPQGVRVEPIVDPTKIALAFFTTLGAMMMMLSRMRKQSREWQE